MKTAQYNCMLCGYPERKGVQMIGIAHNGHAICSFCVKHCVKLLAKQQKGRPKLRLVQSQPTA